MKNITVKLRSICVTSDHVYAPFVVSVLMTYNRVCIKNNTTGATCGVGTAYPSGTPEFTPVASGVCVTGSLVLCVMFCRLLFVLYLFILAIALSILLRFTASDFGIIKYKTVPKSKTQIVKILSNDMINHPS